MLPQPLRSARAGPGGRPPRAPGRFRAPQAWFPAARELLCGDEPEPAGRVLPRALCDGRRGVPRSARSPAMRGTARGTARGRGGAGPWEPLDRRASCPREAAHARPCPSPSLSPLLLCAVLSKRPGQNLLRVLVRNADSWGPTPGPAEPQPLAACECSSPGGRRRPESRGNTQKPPASWRCLGRVGCRVWGDPPGNRRVSRNGSVPLPPAVGGLGGVCPSGASIKRGRSPRSGGER